MWQILLYCWLLPIKSQIISSKRLGKQQLYASMHANFSSFVGFSSFLWWYSSMTTAPCCRTRRRDARTLLPSDRSSRRPWNDGTVSPVRTALVNSSAQNRPVHSQHVNTDSSPSLWPLQWLFNFYSLARELYSLFFTVLQLPNSNIMESLKFKISDALIIEFTVHLM